MSCLDLCYSVTFKKTKVKDEKKDKTAPVVLSNLEEESSESEDGKTLLHTKLLMITLLLHMCGNLHT